MKLSQKTIMGYVMAAAILALAITGLLLPQTRAELSGVTTTIQAALASKGINVANTTSLSKLFQPATYKEYAENGFFKFGLAYAIFAIIGAAGLASAIVVKSTPKRELAIRIFAAILFIAVALIAVEVIRIGGSTFLEGKKSKVTDMNNALKAAGVITADALQFASGMAVGFYLMIASAVLALVVAIKPSLFIEE